MVSSVTESVWNDYERMLVDAYLNWRDGQHTCGRQLSESLLRVGEPEPKYEVITQICLACRTEDEYYALMKSKWEKAHEDGRHPERYTIPRVILKSEADELRRQQQQ